MAQSKAKKSANDARRITKSIRPAAMAEAKKRNRRVVTESIATARNEADALSKHS
jgi:hypothetical protein